jgi:hypothetical protein
MLNSFGAFLCTPFVTDFVSRVRFHHEIGSHSREPPLILPVSHTVGGVDTKRSPQFRSADNNVSFSYLLGIDR